jgi:FixJ family two-component response regulator
MVLLVDDDEDLVEMFALLFARHGIAYRGAHSFDEVKALGDRLAPVTTAILDVNLGPNQPSGVDVADWLRAQGHAMRIVFITGHAPDHPLVRAASGEHGEVLAKPVPTKQLLEIARGRP